MTSPGCGMGKELFAAQDNLEIVPQEVPILYKFKLVNHVKNIHLNWELAVPQNQIHYLIYHQKTSQLSLFPP